MSPKDEWFYVNVMPFVMAFAGGLLGWALRSVIPQKKEA